MGRLVDGQWTKTSIITSDDSGAYDLICQIRNEPFGYAKLIQPIHKEVWIASINTELFYQTLKIYVNYG